MARSRLAILRREKRNAKAKVIGEIRDGNIVFTEPTDIMKCCREFYKDLYSEESIDDSMVNTFLDDTNLPRLPPDIVEHCEGVLSLEQAKEDVSLMKNDKTPGSDGLPARIIFTLPLHSFLPASVNYLVLIKLGVQFFTF